LEQRIGNRRAISSGQPCRPPPTTNPPLSLKSTHTFLTETAARILPRILTQVCRDPGVPFYGACDRNWWHYKIRDFPSIILQQAGYAIHIASTLQQPASCLPPTAPSLQSLAAATARFWNQRALRHGAFEEYYPYEQGYPPVAFATLGVAKLSHEKVVSLPEIRPGLAIATKQLLSRFEAQAANQQIAGTAALAVIRTLDPALIEETRFQKILTDILELQHPEGWFPEYDGPDLGYLAVSIDCLYDIHDHTADPRILPAIRKAADYIAWFALSPIGTAGMHNSRNTDYFTPYGLVRLALEEKNPQIAATVEQLFTRQETQGSGDRNQRSEVGAQRAGVSQPPSTIHHPPSSSSFHPFDAVDDRYWCHYIGHSVFRALQLLETRGWDFQSPPETQSAQFPPSADHRSLITSSNSQPGSGHTLLTSPAGATALVSTRKGGIVTAIWSDSSTASDFGWLLQADKSLLVSHWWSTDWETSLSETTATTEGWLVPHKEHVSEPWKHILLRIAAFVMGRRLIRILKKLVIFKKPLRTHRLTRTVTWEGETLIVTDKITGLRETDTLTRAPRTSKRHVASADSFHPEDLALLQEAERSEEISRTGSIFRCETRYRPLSGSNQPDNNPPITGN
jgi:hypothetical protein